MKFANILLMLILLQFSGNIYPAKQTSSIDVVTTIPVSCQFSNVSPQIIVSENGAVTSGNFTLNCNKNFQLQISSKSLKDGDISTSVKIDNGGKLNTIVKVSFMGNIYQLDGVKQIQVLDPSSSELGTISINLASPVHTTTPAGVYQDVLYLDATF
ncbi:hypothetical protein B9T26_02515 [Acinetobacter sp. ANC 4169]|uniref:hypothetical protein n=1 Tax=Acinetobacter sp. ANC 4169 TaxID=1977879 RepID=UPI000A34B6F2|nr:hypothetical protein [Acinetobacter sp. ANC 4169]OTG76697.1 hypothetical protein B9T26_02515 [Acinetobacter sp. ANC 4169]